MGRRALLRAIALVMAWLPGRARAGGVRAEETAKPAAETSEKPPIRWIGHW